MLVRVRFDCVVLVKRLQIECYRRPKEISSFESAFPGLGKDLISRDTKDADRMLQAD